MTIQFKVSKLIKLDGVWPMMGVSCLKFLYLETTLLAGYSVLFGMTHSLPLSRTLIFQSPFHPCNQFLNWRDGSTSSLHLGKCLTVDNLRKMKIWILDWCYMCKCNGESVDLLFLHYPVASDLWSMVFGLFGVSWVMPQSVVGLLACWLGRFGRHWNGNIWGIILHCLMWCLWKERNSKCFEDIERSIPDLKLFFFRTLLDWLSVLQNQSFSSLFIFLDSCNFYSWLLTPIHSLCTRVSFYWYQ